MTVRTAPAARISPVVRQSTAQEGPTPEVSVVMPCLNEAETLAICIRKARGALRQEGIDGEVIVADNGSTDGSQAIALQEGARPRAGQCLDGRY
jgi:GT2 family glycosyltransferase